MSSITQVKAERLIDARGPRYTAAITTVVLSAALVTESNLIIGFQFAVFLSAVLFGLRRSVYGFIYCNLIQPRLSGPVPSENEAAPRFAQLIGALFAAIALLGGLTGNTTVFLIATSFALSAAFLNAVFGFCLGCKLHVFYLLIFKQRTQKSKYLQ
ncbi:MAG: hypothetical protein GM48_2495 [actinobacterium acIB-AMD-7]|nr:MAG: hypothetical protein GM48_2495 [actinobacterium acIB-AMD-7]